MRAHARSAERRQVRARPQQRHWLARREERGVDARERDARGDGARLAEREAALGNGERGVGAAGVEQEGCDHDEGGQGARAARRRETNGQHDSSNVGQAARNR